MQGQLGDSLPPYIAQWAWHTPLGEIWESSQAEMALDGMEGPV